MTPRGAEALEGLTCEHVFRSLRSTGAAVPFTEKLRLAEALDIAGDASSFPDRTSFLLDWTCNALRAKGSDSPPRLNPRTWRLLLRLLQPVVPEGGALPVPVQLPMQLLSRLAQSSRLLLQAAAAALAASPNGGTGACVHADLAPAVRATLSLLLLSHGQWFRPGVEAVAEYAAAAVAAATASLTATAPLLTGRTAAGGLRSGIVSVSVSGGGGGSGSSAASLRACAMLVRAAVDALQALLELTPEMQPRKVR